MCLYIRGMPVPATPDIRLIDAFADPSINGVQKILGDKVRFRSPYTDYTGRAKVAHLVGLVRGVLIDVDVVHTLHEHPTTISLFDAYVAEEAVQCLLFEEHNDAGLVIDAMLTIRPYAGLRAAMKTMQIRMEDAPLPDER
jgi:hypothetical protein